MDRVQLLAHGLRLAEAAHAQYEHNKAPNNKVEWPEFYAQWLFDNVDKWSAECADGSCTVHVHV